MPTRSRPVRNLPRDPGLEPATLSSPRGPYVGTPPPRRRPAHFANDERLDRVLAELDAGFGPQRWWPAETPFEVIVGAILTQNTAWTNVEQALVNLKTVGPLTPAHLLRGDQERLRTALRPSGYFNAKLKKLLAISRWYLDVGGLTALRELPLEPLRDELLGVWGVGPETADSILCYAAGRRTAIVDAYTRRVLSRHGLLAADLAYETMRSWLQERLVPQQWIYEEFHALVDRSGYEHCKPTARCEACPVTSPTPAG